MPFDAAGAVLAAVESAAFGTFNIVDDQQMTRQEQAQAPSQAVGRHVRHLDLQRIRRVARQVIAPQQLDPRVGADRLGCSRIPHRVGSAMASALSSRWRFVPGWRLWLYG